VTVPAWKGSANCITSGETIAGKPEFCLIPKEVGARTGEVWVKCGWDGICIEGRVNGPAPEWAAKPSDLVAKDHIEVWLAIAPRVTMPLIGWGNQFGDAKLKSADGCTNAASRVFEGTGAVDEEKCRKWHDRQRGYRAWLRRLFVRQRAIGGQDHQVHEELASLAWRHLEATYSKKELPEKLKPRGPDGVHASVAAANQGDQFAVFVPYSAFLPGAPWTVRF